MRRDRFYLTAGLAIIVALVVLGSWFLTLEDRHRERSLDAAGLARIPPEAREPRKTGTGSMIAFSFRGTTADLKDWVAASRGLEDAASTNNGFATVYLINEPEKRIRASVLVDHGAGQVIATVDANDSSPENMRKALISLAACLAGMVFLYGYELRREREE